MHPIIILLQEGRLNGNEYLLLAYTLQTDTVDFGTRWLADGTKELIRN